MKVINPISLARQALSPSAAEREEEQRVLQLFRNRAELKKAYTELQDEIHRLKDRLKQQEGATARVHELLAELEARLGVPETAYPVLVFYQLRRLWNGGVEMLRGFADDLERQQVERERRMFVAETNRQQFERRQRCEAALREVELEAAEAGQQHARLERELRGLNRPWHHFRRREVEERLSAASALRVLTDSRLAEARAAFEAVLAEGEAPFPGLSVEARRSANVSILAYAEILCQRLSRTPLLALARAAMLRRDPSDEYGGRAECEALMAEIARGQALLTQRVDVGAELRARTERLQRTVRYRSEEDTIPDPESAAPTAGDVLARPAQGARAPQPPNVLADDVWDVYRILLR
ncbi:MAG: hypothetical protein MUF07_08750 [Steroidobacteraceae bacterium]|jgi:hypothetical protein|nr:hypothetical protein [Steroidobacteraceae bacterium]